MAQPTAKARGWGGGAGWRAAAALGALLAIAASLAAVGIHLLGPRALEPVDLRVYLAGAAAMVHHAHLYGAGFDPAQRLPFTYPPIAAALMVPLSLLGERLLSVVWDAGSLAALAWTLGRVMGRAGRRAVWAATGLALVTQPVFDNLSLGQVDMLLMAAAVAGCLATDRQPWPAAWVGVAAAVKVVPGLFLVYLLLARRWRPLAVAASAWAVLTGAGFLLRPQSSWRYFTHTLWQVGRPGSPTSYLNQSLWGMVDRLGLGVWHAPVLACAVAVVVVWGLRHALALQRAGQPAAASVAVGLVGVLVSPIAWIHEAVWAVPAVALLATGGLAGLAAASPRALWRAGALALLLAARLPALGARLLALPLALPLAQLLEDAVGLAALTLLTQGPWLAGPPRAPDNASPTLPCPSRPPSADGFVPCGGILWPD